MSEETANRIFEDTHKRALAGMTEEEVETLCRLLTKVRDNLAED